MSIPDLKKILFVEDEEDIRTVTQIALETIGGFTVQVCGSGKEALRMAPHFLPDLILLDVMMPGMDGPATLDALRRLPETMHIPVVFMTAKVQPQEVQRYRDLGAVDTIPKPFDPMTLPHQVRNIWKLAHD